MKFVFSRAEVFTNARAKYFFRSDGSRYLRSITAFPDPIFKKSGFEEIRDETKKKGLISEPNPENAEENRRKSFYRARNKLFDLLLCNGQLGYFVTLTVDEKKADRHEYADVIKKLSNLLDNSVRRKGLAYVLDQSALTAESLAFAVNSVYANRFNLRRNAEKHPVKSANREITRIIADYRR